MSGSSPDEADAEADAEIPVQTALQTLYTSNSDVQEACITARISEEEFGQGKAETVKHLELVLLEPKSLTFVSTAFVGLTTLCVVGAPVSNNVSSFLSHYSTCASILCHISHTLSSMPTTYRI
eukprot:m.312372 g.312372  ORF g.312372 m.312372 type:complete len:123 (+) comp27463_c0_seq8:203-571(+)